MRLWFMVALIFGAFVAPAGADTEPLPASTTVVPRDHEVWTASSYPDATAFEMREFVAYASEYDELPDAFAFAVAATPATDVDGLLAAPIDHYVAPTTPEHPGIYAARTSLAASWLGTPGTYYWQAAYEDDDGDIYASTVRAVTIVTQSPPDEPTQPVSVASPSTAALPAAVPRPPDASTVRIAARRAIHAATHMVARGLVYRCVSAPAAATCRPSWRDVRARYRGALHLTFGANPIVATFTGTRVPRKPGRARTVTWATSI